MIVALYLSLLLHSPTFVLTLELPMGVTLTESVFYTPGKTFTCRNGVGEISWEKVNDDYCDCIDGSDEPGTSACSNGMFHCRDVSYKVVSIPSSLVNDGICDCCDGSDEYNGRISCPSTCGALAAAVEEARSLKRAEFDEGHRKFKEFVKMLPAIKEEKRLEAEKAEHERLAREAEMREQERLRAAAEEERIREEEKMKAAMEEEEKQRLQAEQGEPSVEHGEKVEVEKQPDDHQGHQGDSSTLEVSQDNSGSPDGDQAADPIVTAGEDENDDSHDEDAGDTEHLDNHDRGDEPAETAKEIPEVAIDYGPGEGFRMLAYLDNCLEFTDREYTYTLCPFKNVKQRSISSSHSTSLGRWGHWETGGAETTTNNYSVMVYTGGDSCWNGPDRSTRVHIYCGSENQLITASEPSRCEYLMQVRTPAACYEEPEVLLARLTTD